MKQFLAPSALLALLAVLGSLAIGAVGAPPVSGRQEPEAAPQGIVSDQVIVKVRPWLPEMVRSLGQGALGMRELEHSPLLSASLLSLPPGLSPERASAILSALPWVEYAEPNYRVRAALVPNDPAYGRQQWYYELLGAPQAWDVTTGSSSTVVAVLDAGVDMAHPDLQGRFWTNTAEIPGNGRDDDGNGCVDDVNGCNFTVDPANGDVGDDSLTGHGTFVAGIVAAAGNNGQGLAGVAWGARIMPVKVLQGDVGSSFSVAQGMVYAAKSGARVINMSLGTCHPNRLLEDALGVAHDRYRAVVVAAAGNAEAGCTSVNYPAAYDRAVAVGASGQADPDARAPFSNWGPEVDFVAPGVDICSTFPGGDYRCGDGTSFAAPLVAGTVALLLAKNPALSDADVRAILRLTAKDLPDGSTPAWDGAGRIQIGRALTTGFSRSFIPSVSKE
ncbi:MAG TPA: S8 family serine peptidase [Dehalococcoidia bacterium]|nr:S8 family serine peptidase [Dehalococcoidia bacterium]